MGDGVRKRWWVAAGVVLAAGVAVASALALRPTDDTPAASVPSSAPSSSLASPSPTPSPSRLGPPPNTAAYDLSAVPAVDVFAVIPQLPVDPDPGGAMTDVIARPASAEIPVFADPAGAPVAKLAQSPRESGGAFPVVTVDTDWVQVLLMGRQGVPPTGNAHQTSGWLRRADVQLASNDAHIVVSLSRHTIDLVDGASTTTVATGFAWGTPATPTPIGRTFVMEVAVNPALGYTRGHPIVYLATQSPTLAGFDGENVAVTAIHYHDAHSGAISNGCIRVDAAAIEALDKVPAGTAVYLGD